MGDINEELETICEAHRKLDTKYRVKNFVQDVRVLLANGISFIADLVRGEECPSCQLLKIELDAEKYRWRLFQAKKEPGISGHIFN